MLLLCDSSFHLVNSFVIQVPYNVVHDTLSNPCSCWKQLSGIFTWDHGVPLKTSLNYEVDSKSNITNRNLKRKHHSLTFWWETSKILSWVIKIYLLTWKGKSNIPNPMSSSYGQKSFWYPLKHPESIMVISFIFLNSGVQ